MDFRDNAKALIAEAVDHRRRSRSERDCGNERTMKFFAAQALICLDAAGKLLDPGDELAGVIEELAGGAEEEIAS